MPFLSPFENCPNLSATFCFFHFFEIQKERKEENKERERKEENKERERKKTKREKGRKQKEKKELLERKLVFLNSWIHSHLC